MKILLVAPQPFYKERGTPMAVRLLAETLCGQGHQVDVLAYHDGDDIAVPGLRIIRAARPPGVHHVPIGISWQKLLCDVPLVIKFARLVSSNNYDVVHAVEEAVFPAALFNLFSRGKLVYDMDSSLSQQVTDKWRFLRPFGGVMRLFERLAIGRSDAVFAVCEDLAVKVRPWVGVDRVTVLPDVPMGGSDHLAGESLRDAARPDDVIALYVGNLETYQGIDLMLNAFASAAKDRPIQLVIIGGEEEHIKKYRARALQLKIDGQVRFLGPRPVAQLGGFLEQADILMSPRILGQNTPMKVYSYMQAAKAILATDIRSHTQALDPACAALVAPQPVPYGEALLRLASDPALRARLGSAARLKAEAEYSIAIFKERLQSAYRRLALAS